MTTVTAAELAKNLGDILDRVARGGDEVVIVRDNREIARLVPTVAGMTVEEAFAGLYGELSDEEGEAWLRHSRIPERGLDEELRDPWE